MISFDLRDSIAFVQLNRPEKMNALTGAMWMELGEMFRRIGKERSVRAVILAGAGERAFSAGTDMAELAASGTEQAVPVGLRRAQEEVCALVEDCGVPVIAAIDGLAAGGGFELALACHIRVASTRARFSLHEINLPATPDDSQTQRLSRAIGSGRALEMILTGAEVSAAEALRDGLVNRIVAPAQLLAAAESLASEISRLAPLAIRACLEAVTHGLSLTLEEGLELEAELFSRLFTTEDMREGTRAFLEKRPPVFHGR